MEKFIIFLIKRYLMNKEQYLYIATCRCVTSCVSNTSRRVSQKKVYVAQKMLHKSISQSQDPPANDDMYICVSAANGKTSDISVIQSPGLSTPFHFAFQWPIAVNLRNPIQAGSFKACHPGGIKVLNFVLELYHCI